MACNVDRCAQGQRFAEHVERGRKGEGTLARNIIAVRLAEIVGGAFVAAYFARVARGHVVYKDLRAVGHGHVVERVRFHQAAVAFDAAHQIDLVGVVRFQRADMPGVVYGEHQSARVELGESGHIGKGHHFVTRKFHGARGV